MSGPRVLVVEDEALIAAEIEDRLRRLGYEVIDVVDRGEAALSAAARSLPQIVLMDIRLKGEMDGIEAADRIRERHDIPVLFLTAHSDPATLERAKAAAPYGYLLKPFHERDLRVGIEMALHRHGLEKRSMEGARASAATLASIGDGVIATDLEGRVTYMNAVAEALTQWTFAEAHGRSVDDVFPVAAERTKQLVDNPTRSALAKQAIVSLAEPSVLVTRSRELLPIDDSAAPIVTDQGRVIGAVVAFRDVRRQRLAENAVEQALEQIAQAQRMEILGRLAGGIAHDFNNLLTVINGYCEQLLASRERREDDAAPLREIMKAGNRAAALTSQLLAFSRPSKPEARALQLNSVLADIERMLARLLGEATALTTRLAPDLATIHADPSQVEQVIMNLSVNARDAMPDGGTLTIETSMVEFSAAALEDRLETEPGRFVLLAVRDTGRGIDAATRARIFDPFFTTKGADKGTGLGLSTVYGIVKQAGGFIEVESEVGHGANFKVYWPAASSPAEVAAAPNAPAAPGGGVKPAGETILLVEDDDAVRSVTATVLRHFGYVVTPVNSGEEALRAVAAAATPFRLLVTDVVMPGMGGREVAERVTALRPEIRVLFLSGHTDDAVLRSGVLAGDAAFLKKPFTLPALAAKLRELLAG